MWPAECAPYPLLYTPSYLSRHHSFLQSAPSDWAKQGLGEHPHSWSTFSMLSVLHSAPYSSPDINLHTAPYSSPDINLYSAPYSSLNISLHSKPYSSLNIKAHSAPYSSPDINLHRPPYSSPDINLHSTTHRSPDIKAHSAPYSSTHTKLHSGLYSSPDINLHSAPYKSPDINLHSPPYSSPDINLHSTVHRSPFLNLHSTAHRSPDIKARSAPYSSPDISHHSASYSSPDINLHSRPYRSPDIKVHSAPYRSPDINLQSPPYSSPDISLHSAPIAHLIPTSTAPPTAHLLASTVPPTATSALLLTIHILATHVAIHTLLPTLVTPTPPGFAQATPSPLSRPSAILSCTEMYLKRVLHDIQSTVQSLTQHSSLLAECLPVPARRPQDPVMALYKKTLEEVQLMRSLNVFRTEMMDLELTLMKQHDRVYKDLTRQERKEAEQMQYMRSAVRHKLLKLELQQDKHLFLLDKQLRFPRCAGIYRHPMGIHGHGLDCLYGASRVQLWEPVSRLIQEQLSLWREMGSTSTSISRGTHCSGQSAMRPSSTWARGFCTPRVLLCNRHRVGLPYLSASNLTTQPTPSC
ncbi:hypothetical protein SKAU_G00247240 [Synaphobranchus kaupii]|uniref:Sperm-specific antigen 2 C-terminal domain-containing protein n=1 Tax=Synaphobranchus kaupii TaxID=118154 RepID=A0A9Q1IPG0_SYNKA|nr:hypothetical protein SKAU_G00247240 [Synaphobranchus kaupii]